MICLKCGNEIKDNEQICKKCGYNKNNIINSDNAYATVNRGIYNPDSVNVEEANKIQEEQKQFDQLLQIYIGTMYYNFKKGSFSFCAFFLGAMYFLYRKLYSVGIIIMILSSIISFFFKGNYILSSIISLIFSLFLGIIFKKFYFNECVERVGKLKHDNPNMGFNQLCELARQKGGVNKIIIIPFIIIYALVFIAIIFYAILALQKKGLL